MAATAASATTASICALTDISPFLIETYCWAIYEVKNEVDAEQNKTP